MARFGLTSGGFYTSQSVNADCQTCMNRYPEAIESGIGKSAFALYPVPGLRVFSVLTNNTAPIAKVRGTFQCTVGANGQRMFAVGDFTLFEVLTTGQTIVLGNVGNDGNPVSWGVNNANQLIVCSNGNLFVFPLNGNHGQTRNVGTEVANIATMQAFTNRFQPHDPTTILVTLSGVANVPFSLNTYVAYDTLTNAPFLFLNGQSYPITGIGPDQNNQGFVLAANQYLFQVPNIGESTGIIAEPSAHATGPGFVPFPSMIQVNIGAGPFSFVDFMDGSFLALVANSQQFAQSNLEDGTNWDASAVYQVEEFPDNVFSMKVNQELLWLFGATKTVPYYDSGALLAPYVPVEQVLIEQGIASPYSVSQLDNSLFWIGQDQRGRGIAWRANGYTPVRISTHAIEYAWSQYATISDAVGYAYQDQGHSFWVLTFPTAKATWVYDVATGIWHQRDKWLTTPGQSIAHPSWTHTYCFNKHLVGDPTSGNIYEMNIDFYDMAVTPTKNIPIRRVRRAPHVSSEQQRIFYSEIQIYVESGLGPPQTGGDPSGYNFITLADPSGNLWNFHVTDRGILEGTSTSTGTAQQFVLSRSDGTLWLLSAQASTGRLVATQVPSAYQPVEVINFISPSRLQFAMFILLSGQMEITEVPLTLEPVMMLRWSKDGGHTWSDEKQLGMGKIGEYKYRARYLRMGVARDMVFEVSDTQPIPVRIIDGYLYTSPGTRATPPSSTKRLANQLLEVQ